MRWLLRPGNSGHVSIGSSPGPDQYLLGGLAIAVGYARSNSLGLSAETTVRAVELAIAIGYNRIDARGKWSLESAAPRSPSTEYAVQIRENNETIVVD